MAIFALFGGFITNISPPEHSVSTGFASIIALILFLLIVFTRAGQKLTDGVRRRWLQVAVSCGVAAFVLLLIYLPMKDALAFTMPSSGQEFIGGFWLSADAIAAAQKQQVTDPADILGLFGPSSLLQVWPPASHWLAVVSLYFLYVLSVCAVLGAIFALSEGIGDTTAGEIPAA
ncbi:MULTISPECIES: hypothetical protein [Rhizobium]|uniref:Uncharacterized protein n=1 Tax=Rhizobium aouanii TaxID=3118145 RepID=A0ABU8CL08_9HYPH|nr:hypothetical protein [Rhizobium acaciae]MCW1410733.1 hypothetical protein [Rhizobium acaciae]MCW1742968.1 hypothetical protein [Rhizobium acaciae]MCW1750164.1 hypothetical protein [Rhizobium acaciae]